MKKWVVFEVIEGERKVVFGEWYLKRNGEVECWGLASPSVSAYEIIRRLSPEEVEAAAVPRKQYEDARDMLSAVRSALQIERQTKEV